MHENLKRKLFLPRKFPDLRYVIISLVPRPLPSFTSLAVQLSGRGPGTFFDVSDVTGRKTIERL